MKHSHSTILISLLALAACGGKKAAPAEPEPPPPPPVAEKAPEPEPEPEPPPPPKSWHAQVELTPVKGAKQKAATVTFTQVEGKPVSVASVGWFEGIKSGNYHLVVHEAAACGPNGTKAGKAAAGGDIGFVATAGMDALEVGEVNAIQLDGDGSIVGRTLVLHDDKGGKPGKILACGPITGGE